MSKIVYTENDYKTKCKELNLEYIGIHKEKKKGTMIEFICPKHRNKGMQSVDWSHFKLAKLGCPYCYGKYKTKDDIIPFIKDKNVELISEYQGSEKPINCKCKKCGNVWTTIPKVLTTNGSGCPQCGKERAIKSETKTRQQFINDLKTANSDIKVIGEYVNTHTPILVECKIHKKRWYGIPANLLNKSAGCPYCHLSKSKRIMLEILDKFNINYVRQYSIVGCKYKHKLKFDAFDINNNIAFEFNGEQHYKAIDFAGKGKEWAEKQLELTQSRDKAKIKYCNKNNIPIIIIPYWERDNMEYFIRNQLIELGVLKN